MTKTKELIIQLIQSNKELKRVLSEQNKALDNLNVNLRKQEEKQEEEKPKFHVGEEVETIYKKCGYVLVPETGINGEFCILLLTGYVLPQYEPIDGVRSLGNIRMDIQSMVRMAYESIEADSEVEK